jgi:hypothetical protein
MNLSKTYIYKSTKQFKNLFFRLLSPKPLLIKGAAKIMYLIHSIYVPHKSERFIP